MARTFTPGENVGNFFWKKEGVKLFWSNGWQLSGGKNSLNFDKKICAECHMTSFTNEILY